MKPTDAGRIEGKFVQANGIDIHYKEAGGGPPLLLLHGGVVSTDAVWTGHPLAYVAHMGRLAEHFRVIAPETRGCGRSSHDGGTVTFDRLADDVRSLIGALGLENPVVCGFSEGAITATIVAIRFPGLVHAIVDHAGYDVLNPHAPTFEMMRQMLGGSPEATAPDPDAAARSFGASAEMRATFELMKRDQDAARGRDHWRTYLRMAFERTTRSPGYTFDDLRKITAPTLILVGDRDRFCTVEEGVTAYRKLHKGELSVLPDVGHSIPVSAIDATLAFLLRQRRGAGRPG